MAYSQQQLDAIERAIATGSTRVRYTDASGTKEVEYRSLEDMISVAREMRTQLGGTKRRRKMHWLGYSKGL